MSFDSPRNKRAANISSGSESKTLHQNLKNTEKLQRKRSQIVSNSLRGSIPLLPDDLFPNLPQIKQAKQAEKRLTQKSLPSVVTSKALAVAETRRAKTVFFYKDGDEYFTGVRVPINKGRFRTMDALMDSLNDSIPMPFGVRRLHTPNGKTPIRSIDELQPHGRYIAASSTRRVQGVDLEAVERRKRHREDAQRRWNFQSSPSTTTHGGSANTAQIQLTASKGGAAEINNTHQDSTNMFQSSQIGRASRSRSEKLPAPEASTALSTQQRVNSTFMPVTSKQIYFVLNGNPHRFYRTLVSPLSRGELDHLLEEISEGLHVAIFRIYSFEGDRILNVEQLLQLKDSRAIAVPRHERLQLNGQTNSDILRPIILSNNKSNRLAHCFFRLLKMAIINLKEPEPHLLNQCLPIVEITQKDFTPCARYKRTLWAYTEGARQPSNNIDRLPAYENLTRFDLNIKKKRMLNSTNSQDDTNNNLLKNEVSIRQRSFSSNNAPPVKMAASGAIKVKRKLTTLGPTNVKDTVNTAENTATTSSTITTTTTNTDSDSGRPRSTMEELGNMPDEVNNEGPERDGNENVDGEEDDYPEEPPELMALHQMEKRRRKKSSKGKNEGGIGENEEGEEREEEMGKGRR
uniref:Doublecortin domain-containing protein n=1 Tax=Meloidogyne enterolobii TaxID=390850 RepID=A0A6V7VR05_MELEN|nr:unnamed protein product [Meloidogyne enterolobii]